MSPSPFLQRHLIAIDGCTSASKENQTQNWCSRGQCAHGSGHHSHEPRLAALQVIFLLFFAVVELSVSFKHRRFLLFVVFNFFYVAQHVKALAGTVPCAEWEEEHARKVTEYQQVSVLSCLKTALNFALLLGVLVAVYCKRCNILQLRWATRFWKKSAPLRGGPPFFEGTTEEKIRGARYVLRIWRGRFSFVLRWCGFFLGFRFLYALLERLHQVNNLCSCWRFWRCNRNFSAFALLI